MENSTKIIGREVLLPSLRGTIGKWTYYLSKLSFKQVSDFVSPVNEEIHSSSALRDQLQRSITDNYLSIKKYILGQDERFFNALVLAVYEGDPEWVEVELNYNKQEYFNLGFLKLGGAEIIFPVDGQHRVEGIKEAIKENKKLEKDSIPVILIGHTSGDKGRVRTRRLFSTLNRYAKPVSLGDTVALDEDDVSAIITRNLLESHPLFKGKRVTATKQKAVPESEKVAITSLITLYQCNLALIKSCHKTQLGGPIAGKALYEFLKFRPDDNKLAVLEKYVTEFWDDFLEKITIAKLYSKISESNLPAKKYRENISGGNLLFRPIGLLPFIEACVFIEESTHKDYGSILLQMNKKVQMSINQVPWLQVVWNDFEKTMLTSNSFLTKFLILHMFDTSLISPANKSKLVLSYSARLGSEKEAKIILAKIAG